MKKSYVIALVMSVVIIAWMASGILSPTNSEKAVPQAQSDQAILVETQLQKAQAVQLSLNVQGQVEPLRQTAIRSDLDGRVANILVSEGAWVEAGTRVITLDPEDRTIKLARENALLLTQQQTYARAQTLVNKGLQPSSTLDIEFAALKTAQASVAQIELEISKLNVLAPFSGVINQLDAEQNSFIKSNSDIAQVIDNSKLLVVIPVAQQDISKLRLGLEANVNFATGQSRTGIVQFISAIASASTRTFRVEIIIDNAARDIPAGISAEVTIPIQEVEGHFVSPAILALDAAGQMGVKSVGDNDVVMFSPISIIKASTNGIWVTGLPSTVNIITIGQGFVEAGARVKWTPADALQQTPLTQASKSWQSNNANEDAL